MRQRDVATDCEKYIMDSAPPVPKPRVNRVEQKYPSCETSKNSAKKPIPLPRLKAFNEINYTPEEINTQNLLPSEIQECSIRSNSNENSDRMQCNKRIPSKNLKEEWKIDCEDVQLKGKSVIERTRTVSSSIEKSVRNIISRRLTVRSASPNKVNDLSALKIGRSRSLPSEDIFQSISFHSPLSVETTLENPVVTCEEDTLEEEEDCSFTSGPPPPVYPPPPLPDESVYDEVQSVVSSHSSGYDPYYDTNITDCEKLYEDISLMRENSEYKFPEVSQKITQKKHLGSSRPSCENKYKFTLRSDSWSFYDTTPEKDIYQSVNTPDSTNFDDDCLIYNRDCSSKMSGTDSNASLSVQGNLTFENSDEMYRSELCSNSHSQSSSPRSVSIQNDLYENWETSSMSNIPVRRVERKNPTKSVILEFDPLYENIENCGRGQDSFNELLMTDDTIRESESPYGKISRVVKPGETEPSTIEENGEFVCPPVPPRRYDSITLTSDAKSVAVSEPESEIVSNELSIAENDVNSQGSTLEKEELVHTVDVNNSDSSAANVSGRNRRTALVRWASMKRAIQLMTDGSSLRRLSKEQVTTETKSGNQNAVFYGGKCDVSIQVERPNWVPQVAVQYSGMLYRSTSSIDRMREFVQRRCVLAEGKLSCFSDKTGTSINEVIPLDKVLSVQSIPEHKVGSDGEDLRFFELNVSWKGSCYLFGVSGSTERRVWMQKILESLTSTFPVRLLTDFARAGWCYIKEGVSGIWTSGWILVHKRTLFYCVQDGALQELDLRKARCIGLQDSKRETSILSVTEKGSLILVDFPGRALYLQMDTPKETGAWHIVIRAAAVDNGLHLAQQQLTRDEIPTIIDKCINFVYAHGSMSEGIYRRSGANSSVTRLLTLFRQDAWAVQLTRQEYSEYDVASVLKRFLRDLPEPLFSTELHPQLCEIAAGKRGSDKMVHYRRVLEQLPPINYLTARKLIGHLYFIHQQHEKNLMPVENLAAIWGPTLMHVEGTDNLNWSKLESGVVSDMILLYSKIFEVDAAELSREKRMLEVLERYHSANSAIPQNKPSGDLKIWIHLERRDSTNCVNVTVGPQKLAGEVCAELSNKIALPAHELCLEEVVCGGALTRPLHHMERVLDVVLRWGYWSDVDRKDNCLVLCQNTVFKEAAMQTKYPLASCGELRFADRKSRSFKTYLFEFSQAKLCYYKDKRGSVKLGEWKIEDIVWYLGYEPKRNPQMRWAITFIDKNNKPERSKENPFFGYTIAGTSKEEQVRWIGAMLAGEHPQSLMPSPVLLQ